MSRLRRCKLTTIRNNNNSICYVYIHKCIHEYERLQNAICSERVRRPVTDNAERTKIQIEREEREKPQKRVKRSADHVLVHHRRVVFKNETRPTRRQNATWAKKYKNPHAGARNKLFKRPPPQSRARKTFFFLVIHTRRRRGVEMLMKTKSDGNRFPWSSARI